MISPEPPGQECLTRAGILIRSSVWDRRDENSKVHEARVRRYAAARGWAIVRCYRVRVPVGFPTMDDWQAQKMLADVRHGRIDALVCSQLAQFASSPEEILFALDHFHEAGARLVSIRELVDTYTIAGPLCRALAEVMAERHRRGLTLLDDAD